MVNFNWLKRLLLVAEQLREPNLDTESRLTLVEQFCGLLDMEAVEEVDWDYFVLNVQD